MAMTVNTNVPSLNAQRNLGMTGISLGRSIGRLSSGFRINRAADDAAGLGIANKLRADTRSLRQASRNAEQSNSLLQVAEGAAQTVQNIVERMKELATQASSDNTDSAGRGRIDAEFDNLRSEITRIVSTTKFQGSALLDGTFGNGIDLATSTLDDAATVQSVAISGVTADTYTVTHTADTLTITNSGATLTEVVDITGDDGIQLFSFQHFGVSFETNNTFVAGTASATGDVVVTGSSAQFMVSSSGAYTTDDLISLSAMDMTVATLGIDIGAGTDLSTSANAQAALTDIDGALAAIATSFGEIGSTQNRIDFAFQNVQTSIENFAAAESTIRDADMAAEMASFTRYSILQQAGVAMLAQANALPQLVLQLLG